jgi:hypothetical protein
VPLERFPDVTPESGGTRHVEFPLEDDKDVRPPLISLDVQ